MPPVRSALQDDVSATTQDSSVRLLVWSVYLTSSGNGGVGTEVTPVVWRCAAKRTMVVSVGASKRQLALALPCGADVVRKAESGPPLAQEFVALPSPDGAGAMIHPAAAFGVPVGPLQEKTL